MFTKDLLFKKKQFQKDYLLINVGAAVKREINLLLSKSMLRKAMIKSLRAE